VHRRAGNEVFPRQVHLEPVTDERLPETTADGAGEAGAQQEDEDLHTASTASSVSK